MNNECILPARSASPARPAAGLSAGRRPARPRPTPGLPGLQTGAQGGACSLPCRGGGVWGRLRRARVVSARPRTAIRDEAIKCRRGGESCLPAFPIRVRYFGTSLIKAGRLEFPSTEHSIPTLRSQERPRAGLMQSGVMARIIPVKISGRTGFGRLTGAVQSRPRPRACGRVSPGRGHVTLAQGLTGSPRAPPGPPLSSQAHSTKHSQLDSPQGTAGRLGTSVGPMGGRVVPKGNYAVLFPAHLEIWRKHFDLCRRSPSVTAFVLEPYLRQVCLTCERRQREGPWGGRGLAIRPL